MFTYTKQYDVIVVGAGHAGIEAALSASRMGCLVLLLTTNADTIGQMSCNPAIGGTAKGHLVREIDALGGEMGRNADYTGLQFRMLNTKKGPAVWSPRAQCDKKAYQFRLKWICEMQPNLDVKQGHTTSIIFEKSSACGVRTSIGVCYLSKTVIITTGTFLHGLMHIGSEKEPGGRSGEQAAVGLSASLREVGIELMRLKTGTPPRLLARSINFSQLEAQGGDTPIPFFSFWPHDSFHVEQVTSHLIPNMRSRAIPSGTILERGGGQKNCYITRTTAKTQKIIKDNIHLSPLYSGEIVGVGPRYCPSIEDKITRFKDRETHQIFLEPEGIATDEIYINGLSTSLPFEVQIQLVRSVIGCENAEIIRPAYAVEYDFAPPTQLQPTLEAKACENLYLAGQINGTSGYEEAAAQGIMAGINAALRCFGRHPLVLSRDQAYIGVLIDDLVNLGTLEPYRMFTSRAEYRLLLRQDNADRRLSEIGHRVGLLSNERHQIVLSKSSAIASEIARLNKFRVGSETLAQILRKTEIAYDDLPQKDDSLPFDVKEAVEIEIKYAGYIARQIKDVEQHKASESKLIPIDFDYTRILGLSTEAQGKLGKIRPISLGQAGRISGVTPSDVNLLAVWLKRYLPIDNNVGNHSTCGRDEPGEPHLEILS
ncbi:MAG: tRNA uridine-5-carboxymethylaminomethyl(34) synthesis enzyme MnmG [Verrucomicrobiota bacterium]